MVNEQERKGYFHAIEGIIAALIIVIYLTSFVSVPEPTDWTNVHITQESEELLAALDDAGILDHIILEDDGDSFNAVLNSLNPSLSYAMQIHNLPPPRIDTAVITDETYTYEFSTTPGDWGAGDEQEEQINVFRTQTQSDWNQGEFTRTSADRDDNSGTLGIGYLDGTAGDNLIGYWRMDRSVSGNGGNVLDYSGNQFDGTTVDGVGTGIPGVFSTDAFEFHGQTDGSYVDIPDDTRPEDTDPFTISLWIRPDTMDFDDPMGVMGGRGLSSENGKGVALSFHIDGDFYFDLYDDDSRSALPVDQDAAGWAVGEWHHVVAQWDGTTDQDGKRIWINGNEIGSMASNVPEISWADTDVWSIGREEAVDRDSFDGRIDEVQVYETFLSQAEIEELYFNGPDPFEGEYSSEIFDAGDSVEWLELNIDATIPDPDDTSAEVTFEALDSGGNPIDQETFTVSDGDLNYSLAGVTDSQYSQWHISGSSTEEGLTWEVDEAGVYYETDAVVGGEQLPDSEHGYRKGNLTEHPAFGDVPFILSDTTFDGVQDYDSVNFDFDGSGEFASGPYQAGDRFECTAGVTGCDGDYYEVGIVDDTLVLYDATFARMLSQRMNQSQLDTRDIHFNIETVNPAREHLAPFDAAITHSQYASLSDHEDELTSFVGADNVLVAITDIDQSSIEGTVLDTLGFEYEAEHGLYGEGPETNVLFGVHESGSPSYRPNNYFMQTNIDVVGFTDAGGYEETTFTVQEEDVTVRRHTDDTITFSTDDFNAEHREGDLVNLLGNTYVLVQDTPMQLKPTREHRFSTYNTARIRADYYMTKMEHYEYNTSLYDLEENWTQEYQTQQDQWGDIARSPCEGEDQYPYKRGTIDLEDDPHPVFGDRLEFLMVNFEQEAFIEGPDACTEYLEFAYFDLDGDPPGQVSFDGADEGPYQRGDTLDVDGRSFTVLHRFDGQGLKLEAEGPRIVGEIPVSENAIDNRGSAALFNREDLGDDDIAVLRSLLLGETGDNYWFTPPRAIGSPSFSYTYTGKTKTETPEYYMLDTVWWYE